MKCRKQPFTTKGRKGKKVNSSTIQGNIGSTVNQQTDIFFLQGDIKMSEIEIEIETRKRNTPPKIKNK